MPGKRGRPILNDTDDLAILRRRQQAAERARRFYEQRRAAAHAHQTQEQLEQAESIAEHTFEDVQAAQTLQSLGLRIQNVLLAQDAEDAQLQHGATPVDEHHTLYYEDEPTAGAPQNASDLSAIDNRTQSSSPIQPIQPCLNQSGQSHMTQFFRSLPPQNPFASLQRDSPPTLLDAINIETYEEGQTVHWNTVGENEEIAEGNLEREESDEESSVHSFVSEHSYHTVTSGSEGNEDAAPSAHQHTLAKLYEQLQLGFHGCSLAEHAVRQQEHMTEAGGNHHSLSEIFNDPSFPSVLGLPEMVSADRLARQRTPVARQWQAMFCGTSSGRSTPKNVCLHREETRAVEPHVAFDVDSFLGFASTLALARQGLWYQPAPQMRQNMKTDVHIETNVFPDGGDTEAPTRSHLAMLKDVPHFLLGRVVGAHDITVHVLFPHLASADTQFVSLTKEQLTRWLDRVFHPAVYEFCDAHYTQHLPASYRHALANSKAHQIEARSAETASYQAQQSIGYHLQPEYLDQIWTKVLETINNTPGLADFREPQIFFSAKGTKLQFKTSPSRPSMLDAMENFESYLERVIDLDFVHLNQLYVDLGKEICPRVSLLLTQRRHMDDEAQVYSWKRCCLEHYIDWIYDGQPPSAGSDGQRYFSQNMLYEACGLTSLTPKRSRLRKGGLIYSQFYGSVKEVSDATKCMPFNHDGLEEIALDPQIRQGAKSAAGGNRRDAKIIERAYCASKQRARNALLDSRKKSFGIREEHRISWALFQGLMELLREQDREQLDIQLFDCPSYAWPVRTEVYLNYLWRSADKFATGFEVVLAGCQKELITWEQTKMMAMFLRCLRFVFGGHLLQRESSLWWSRRERSSGNPPQERVWYGLGFCNTLPRYKYCWLEPRFDWSKIAFQSEITDRVLFGNSMLRGQYLRRGGQVADFFNATYQMEMALEWIGKHHQNRTVRNQLISWMAHVCLHQFRMDIINTVKLEVLEDERDDATRGTTPLCYEYLEEILSDRVHLISGNRCDFKRVGELREFLFDFNDGRIRRHWEDKPYRKLYHRGLIGLELHHGVQGLGSRFIKQVWRKLYAYHWILPYPNADGFMQTTKEGDRMWYSIQTREDEEADKLEWVSEAGWRWERKAWRAGRPRELPEYVEWTKEKWIEWIQEQGQTEE
jgi:hypothetical protein